MVETLVVAAVGGAIGWFKAGSAGDWDENITGNRGTGQGSILEILEQETGQTYPRLQKLWQECEDTWVAYQEAWPWGKANTLKVYNKAVVTFYDAVVAEEAAQTGIALGGGLVGITGYLKEPLVLISIVAAIVLVAVMLAMRR